MKSLDDFHNPFVREVTQWINYVPAQCWDLEQVIQQLAKDKTKDK